MPKWLYRNGLSLTFMGLTSQILGVLFALQIRMTIPVRIPAEFDELPEPGRSKAFEFFKELVEAGSDARHAIAQARERARSWVHERVRAPTDACGILPHDQGACPLPRRSRDEELMGDSGIRTHSPWFRPFPG